MPTVPVQTLILLLHNIKLQIYYFTVTFYRFRISDFLFSLLIKNYNKYDLLNLFQNANWLNSIYCSSVAIE